MTSASGSPGAPDAAPGTAAETAGAAAAAAAELRAPHRRRAPGRRLREKIVVLGYRAGQALLGHLPLGPASTVGGLVGLASYAVWPEKRRIVRANCARVLGLPESDPAVGRLARRVYRNQVRWILEVMRLGHLAPDEIRAQVDDRGADEFHAAWEASRGVIAVGLHLANNEVCLAALAGRGWPMHAVADDTAYEDLYAHLARERERWGINLVPWRNLREVFRVLRRHDILGLLVDWGYRPDGIPIRFFGTWTTFPAGPAVLAAKSGATIVPFWFRRRPDGVFDGGAGPFITVASVEPAELARATQALADALEAGVRQAPEQWCVFKPIWPTDPAEERRLAALHVEQAGIGAPAG